MTKALSLYQLNTLVADVISNTMAPAYWVEAELSEARESNGHCYMELIEKEEGGNVPIARASAKCWRNVWSMIKPYFMRITGPVDICRDEGYAAGSCPISPTIWVFVDCRRYQP